MAPINSVETGFSRLWRRNAIPILKTKDFRGVEFHKEASVQRTKSSAGRLIAIDPSLTCSGWALFRVDRERLVAVGKLKSLPASYPLAERLRDLQQKFQECLACLELNHSDYLVCEAPTTMRDPRAALLVEQVRTLFETLARERKINVPGRINPRTVHHEVIGLKGRQLPRLQVKEAARSVVHSLYRSELEGIGFPVSPKDLKRHQDIVDAILIGVVAMSRVRSAYHSGVQPEVLFESLTRRNSRVRARV